ncbi:MAG: hypothetical protein Q8R55_02000 [Candidatus Taylorbacteria bacterium]|nr:hypothetical protein [Candidatus Taylorbacteria bacterium]
MDPPIVYIEKEPFLNMIIASVETFKRECVGYVFGYKPTRERNSFVITNSVAIQLAKKRKNSEVEQSQLSGMHIDDCFKKYPSLFRVIGDFHSHPEWGSCKGLALPTDRDIKNMEKGEMSIIIAISSINKDRVLWQGASGGGIKGSLSKYKFHLNAFRLIKDKDDKQTEELLVVHAPAAIKALNRALGYI